MNNKESRPDPGPDFDRSEESKDSKTAPDYLRKKRQTKTFLGFLGVIFFVVLAGVFPKTGFSPVNVFILLGIIWALIWWKLAPRLYPRFVGDTVICPECEREVQLIDNWKCPGCGDISSKHILKPCPKCKTIGAKLGCSFCQAVIYV